jgi:hypothetical protein
MSSELQAYYENNKLNGKRYNTQYETKKWGSEGADGLPKSLSKISDLLASCEFLKILQEISGIDNLKITAEPNSNGYSIFHVVEDGGALAPHIDHTFDMKDSTMHHVLNVILYISPDWDVNWGGATQLYNKNVKLKGEVECVPNRALIFLHSPISVHGTKAVNKLENDDVSRNTIYFDYYSSSSDPFGEAGYPIKNYRAPHTFFPENKIDLLKTKNRRYLKFYLANLLGKIGLR